MDIRSYHIISQQYLSFKENRLPKIADNIIKAIPIEECGEVLIDIQSMHQSHLTMLANPSKPFESADFNSGFRSASKIRLTLYFKLKKMSFYLNKMAPQFGFKRDKISIKVFEGLRDLTTQATLFENKMQEIHQANPHLKEQEVYLEASKWVSPVKDNIPAHSTGAAIDIRLFDEEKKKFIDMGQMGAIWGENKSAPTFSPDITDEQMKNRLFLLIAAGKAGLINYPYEFWHYSSGDRYATFWIDNPSFRKKARYGGIN